LVFAGLAQSPNDNIGFTSRNGTEMRLHIKSAIVFIFLISISTFAWSGELSGLWQEYDDDTGKLVALIRIEMLPDNTYEGRIENIFPHSGEGSELICRRCTGRLRNQPLLGLRILSGIKRIDKLNFEEGEILDPGDGKSYRCHIKLSGDSDTIQVTGYISLNWIGQSEIWRRTN
jgi:uncharacterized protein (DUF2147 family)